MSSPKALFILTGNRDKASSRVRGFWIAEKLRCLGGRYHIQTKHSKLSLLKLFIIVPFFDSVIFQKVYSRYHIYLMMWADFLGKKTYLDIDDAPSRTQNPTTLRNFAKMVKMSDSVWCGSYNLMEYVNHIDQNKAIYIPTSVKIGNYPIDTNIGKDSTKKILVFGWIGNGKHYRDDLIRLLVPAFAEISKRYRVRFKLIGACGEKMLYKAFEAIENLELEMIDHLDWGKDMIIADALSDVDVGLYPLLPKEFNKFKCGFKALEYMAMGLPVISSNVALNKDIVLHKETGYLVDTKQEWVEAMELLIKSPKLRNKMGKKGRNVVKEKYSVQKTAFRIKELLKVN